MPRPPIDDIEKEPDYEAALAAYVAAHPESPEGQAQAALERTHGAPPPMTQPVAALRSMVDGAGPADVAGIQVRPHVPTRAEQISKAVAEGGDLTPFLTQPSPDARPPATERPGSMEASLTALQTQPGPGARAMPEAPSFGERLARGAAEMFTGPGLLQAMRGEPRTERTPLQALSDKVDDIRNPLPDVSMPLPGVAPPAQVPPTLTPPSVRVGKAAHVDVPNTAVVQSRAPAQGATPAAPGGGDPVRRALTALALSAAPPRGQDDLDAALQAAAGRRLAAESARAGAAMVGRGNDPAYAQMIAEADRPVEEFQARRALSADERQQAALRAAADAARQKQAFSEEMGRGELKVKQGSAEETARHNKAMEAIKSRAHSGGGTGGAGLSKEAAKELAVLQRTWDPSGPRSGERGKNQARVNAAGRIEALALGPDGKPANLNPQQMTELARQLDTLLSNGGQATEGVTRALTAHTATGKVADLLQWWTSKPHGAEQQAFVQQMLETAHRERDVAGRQLRDSYVQTLPSVPTLLKERPDVVENMLRAAGVDPGGIDLGTGLARPGAASPAGAGPARISTVEEYNALPAGAEYIDPNGKHKRKGGG